MHKILLKSSSFIILFTILNAEYYNKTDKDELWNLLLERRLSPITTNDSDFLNDGEYDDKVDYFINGDIDKSFEEDLLLPDVSVRNFDDTDDGSGMQADGADFRQEAIQALKNHPDTKEILNILGLLQDEKQNKTDTPPVSDLFKPLSEREWKFEDKKKKPIEELQDLLPEMASLTLDNIVNPSIKNILLTDLKEKLPDITTATAKRRKPGQKSLVIVFDATGSMVDDLAQLRRGAELIIDEITMRDDNPIYNYIFVPFRDPNFGPRLVTTEKEELMKSMQNLSLFGGGDCPESALAGISNALEVALPNSLVYVFTDATAKDFKLDDQVLELVQRKQTPITFLLTGFCDGKETKGYKVMTKIAAASNGEVYDLKKHDIEEVLMSIQSSLDIKRVPLKSVDSDTAKSHSIDFNVDINLKEFSVSVAGNKPEIEVIDPMHQHYNNTKEVLNLENIKMINVQDPIPGKWNIVAGSNSSHSVRLSGISDITYKFGFSLQTPNKISETSFRPLLGSKNIFSVSPSNSEMIQDLKTVTVAFFYEDNRDEKPFNFSLPLRKIENDGNIVYVTEAFEPPRQRFKIMINGNDADGNPMERLLSTVIQSINLYPPEVMIDNPQVELYECDELHLKCTVASLVPIEIKWKKFNDIVLLKKANQSSELDFIVNKVDLSHNSRYTCEAVNEVGKSEMIANVKVKPRPIPVVTVSPKAVKVQEHEENVEINCLIENATGQLTEMSWIFNDEVEISDSHTLTLNNIKRHDAGKYTCLVKSYGHKVNDSALLIVQHPPTLNDLEIEEISIPYKESAFLSCQTTAIPEAEVTWKFNNNTIVSNKIGDDLYYISSMESASQGEYLCEAKNYLGMVTRKIKVTATAIAPPEIIHPNETLIYANLGDDVELSCICDLCQPLGYASWTPSYLSNVQKEFVNDSSSVNYKLKITNITTDNEATYECVLANTLGYDSMFIKIAIMTPPEIETFSENSENEEEIKLIAGKSTHIKCEAKGIPIPVIVWFKDGVKIIEDFRIHSENSSALILNQADISDAGIYACKAINPLGQVSRNFTLVIVTPPKITDYIPAVQSGVVGKEVILPCAIHAIPPPEITWMINENLIEEGTKIIDANNSLRFEPKLDDSGIYECRAENEAGNATQQLVLTIFAPPIFYPADDEIVRVTSKSDVVLKCDAVGHPTPEYSWTHDGNPIQNQTQNSHKLDKISVQNAGTYVCDANNGIGFSQKLFYLVVSDPPKITSTFDESVSLKPGTNVSFNCEAVGNPIPETYWMKDDKLWSGNKTLTLKYNETDPGTYTCVSENVEGSEKRSVQVKILDPPKKLENYSENNILNVRKGDSVKFMCPFGNYNNISWRLNGTILEMFESTFEIKDSRKEDQGNYTCSVENEVGQDQYYFILNILSPPNILSDEATTEDATEVNVMAGEDFNLECLAHGNPTPTVYWTKDQHNVSNSKTLSINNIGMHHKGTYVCVAENNLGASKVFYNLQVTSPPIYPGKEVSYFEASNEDSLSLDCMMEGNPHPTVNWFKDGLGLDEFQEVLELRNVDLEDAGKYQCIAENIYGSKELKFDVIIYQPAQITHIDSNKTIPKRTSLQLDCQASGSPLPMISWVFNGKILSSTTDLDIEELVHDEAQVLDSKVYPHIKEKFSITKTSQHELKLTLINSDVSEWNSGKYICMTVNAVGRDEKTISVKVTVPPFIDKKIKFPKEFDVLEGLPLYLSCPMTGTPLPEIIWYKENKKLESNVEIMNSGKTLFISETIHFDAGNYSCWGENEAGKFGIQFSVKILVPPILLNNFIPYDVNDENLMPNNHEEIYVRKGDNLTLDCSYIGSPDPEIFWTEVNYLNEKSHLLEHDGHYLELEDIFETASYSCYINNTVGLVEKIFHVNVESPPYFGNTDYQSSQSVELYHGLNLNCDIVGVPDAFISWTKDNKIVTKHEKGFFISSDGQTLRIISARKTDAGLYKCSGENKHGIISREFLVDVDVIVSWSPWGKWSGCSSTCGKGSQFRSRICLLSNGVPAKGVEYNCVGENVEVKDCELLPCPVNGGWGDWSNWSDCSVTCQEEYGGDKAVKYRYRKCDSPKPALGGKPCLGIEYEEEKCNVPYCPIDGEWTDWTEWTPCSSTCGYGQTFRFRACSNPIPQYGGKMCEGDRSEIKICNTKDCSVNGGWSDWTPWSKCSKSCGAGVKQRKRFCNNPEPKNGGTSCEGENVEMEKCKERNCQNNELLKNIEKDPRKKYTPFMTFEAKSLESDNSRSEERNFKIIKNYKYVERPSVERVEKFTPRQETPRGKKYFISLENSVPLSNDTAVYSLNLGGQNSNIMQQENFCMLGMVFNTVLGKCVDLNECDSENTCDESQNCVNEFGTFRCECKPGYELDDFESTCIDVDECVEQVDDCSHFCENTIGGYSCFCPAEFWLETDGKTCSKREPLAFKALKDEVACAPGFHFEQNKCVDVDECFYNADDCASEQKCLNTKGSYLCIPTSCPSNYKVFGNNGKCIKTCTSSSCENGAKIAEILHQKQISAQKVSPNTPILDLEIKDLRGIPIEQTSFQFTDRFNQQTFNLIQHPRRPGVVQLFANRWFLKEKVYKLEIVGYSYGKRTQSLDYVNIFVIYLYSLN